MWKIILGAIIIFVGVITTMKSEWILQNFGSVAWFEQHLGTSGGTRLGYKLMGLLVIFFGILVMTNLLGGFMNWMLSPLLTAGIGG
jgi:hypothetical protein